MREPARGWPRQDDAAPRDRVVAAVAERPAPSLAARIRSQLDLPLVLAALLVVGVVLWAFTPPAHAVTGTSDTTVSVGTDTSLAVVPGFTRGDTQVQLGDLNAPGQQRDASSGGWVLSTNWVVGYTVAIRSATNPAMRGKNAVDKSGAADSFKDFTLSGCPCPWKTSGFGKGIFGYSATISKLAGPAALDTSKWGTSDGRKWRGFNNSDYTLYQTPGGAGKYGLKLFFRTALPPDGSQLAGSYRATVLLSVHANI